MNITHQYKDHTILLAPFREEVTASSRGQLLSEVKEFATRYGEDRAYSHITPLHDNKFEVAYHRETGFLLAESVNRFFGNIPHLIWCEPVQVESDNPRLMIIVIKDHQVRLDGEIPLTAVASDIGQAIGEGEEQFSVFVHGETPLVDGSELGDSAQFGQIAIDPDRVARFTQLETSVFELIDWNKSDMAITHSKAVSAAGYPNRLPIYVLVLLFFGVGMKALFFVPPPEVKTVVVDEYKEYRQAMNKPSAVIQLHEFLVRIHALDALNSWELKAATFHGSSYDFFATPTHRADFSELETYQRSLNASLSFENKLAKLSDQPVITPITLPGERIADANLVLGTLLEKVTKNRDLGMSVKGTARGKNYKIITAVIAFEFKSIESLQGLLRLINGLPVVLEKIELANAKGLIAGDLVLNVIGA